jgi:solute:Na+ symporter, SSS family
VTVGVSMVTQPKPAEELRGLAWGLTRKEEEPEEHDPADDAWYRSPWLLGAGAIVLIVVLNIVFI